MKLRVKLLGGRCTVASVATLQVQAQVQIAVVRPKSQWHRQAMAVRRAGLGARRRGGWRWRWRSQYILHAPYGGRASILQRPSCHHRSARNPHASTFSRCVSLSRYSVHANMHPTTVYTYKGYPIVPHSQMFNVYTVFLLQYMNTSPLPQS